jgi:hypothetical protein
MSIINLNQYANSYLLIKTRKKENIKNIIKYEKNDNDNDHVNLFIDEINNGIYFIAENDFIFSEYHELKFEFSFSKDVDIKFDYFLNFSAKIKLLLMNNNKFIKRFNIDKRECNDISSNDKIVIILELKECKKGNIIAGIFDMLFITNEFETQKTSIPTSDTIQMKK